MRSLAQAILVGSIMFGAAGCTSVSSTYITRNPFGCGWKTKYLRGAPVTVWVPSHLELRVTETRYLFNGELVMDGKEPLTTRGVEIFVREKKEVFTVDFVRTGGGTAEVTADYHKDQYFSKSTGSIEDTNHRIDRGAATASLHFENTALAGFASHAEYVTLGSV